MQKKALTRRYFLKGVALSACLPVSSYSSQIKHDINKVSLYSAATDSKGLHWLVVTNSFGTIEHRLSLPARAHEVFKHPSLPLLCVVGRRPGKYMALVHTNTGTLIKTITPSQGYHFYGHGLFSHDGRYLVSSENHIESGEGRITVRDRLSDFAIVNQYASVGIGPHEIKLSIDGKRLVVANGGIKTHPDKGREKLNIDTMRPSLVYLDLYSGVLLEKVYLPPHLHQLSIRHIDINNTDQVVIAMQYQGDKTDQVPLMATHQLGEGIKLLAAPINAYLAMKHYCGSVSFDFSGRYAGSTSPKGDRFTLWDIKNACIIDQVRCRDACGVAALGGNGFVISSGSGKLYRYDIEQKSLSRLTFVHQITHTKKSDNISHKSEEFRGMSWDNHLSLSV